MVKKGLVFGIVGFIVVFGLLYSQQFLQPTKKEVDTGKIILNSWKEKAILLAHLVSEGVSEEDEIVTSITFSMVKDRFSGCDYLTIIANDGTILADMDTTKILESYTGPRISGNAPRTIQKGKYFDIGVPVIFGDEKVGEIHLGIKYEKVYPEKKEKPSMVNYAMLSGVSFILFFIIGIILTRGGVSSPRKDTEFAEIETLREEVEKLKEAVNNLRSEEENLTKALDEKRAELNEIQQEINNKKEEMKSIESDWQNIGEKRMQVEELRSELSKLTVALDQKKKELEEIENNIKAARTKAEQAPASSEEEALLSSIVGEGGIDARLEEKRRQEVELTQRIVAKRREEIALSARIEAKRKELIEIERKIEELKGKLQE